MVRQIVGQHKSAQLQPRYVGGDTFLNAHVHRLDSTKRNSSPKRDKTYEVKVGFNGSNYDGGGFLMQAYKESDKNRYKPNLAIDRSDHKPTTTNDSYMLAHVKSQPKASTENNRREMRGGATLQKDRKAGNVRVSALVSSLDAGYVDATPQRPKPAARPMATPLVATPNAVTPAASTSSPDKKPATPFELVLGSGDDLLAVQPKDLDKAPRFSGSIPGVTSIASSDLTPRSGELVARPGLSEKAAAEMWRRVSDLEIKGRHNDAAALTAALLERYYKEVRTPHPPRHPPLPATDRRS